MVRKLVAHSGAIAKKLFVPLALVAALVTLPGRVAAAVELAVDGDHLSAQVDGAALEEVLAAISADTGIRVEWVVAPSSVRVSVAWERVPLAVALEELLEAHNHGVTVAGSRPVRVWVGSAIRGRVPVRRSRTDETAAEIEDLRYLALEEADVESRRDALAFLATRDAEGARDAIGEALARDADPAVRAAALSALDERTSDGSDSLLLGALADAVTGEGWPAVARLRDKAVRDPAAEATLVQLANTSPDTGVRELAGRALDELDEVRARG
jgi:hypothetical protein